jgi:histidyl-tRNA synthetase
MGVMRMSDRTLLTPLPGFSDRMDPYLLANEYVGIAISQKARRNGWKEYSPPALERPETYDEQTTGYLGATLDDGGFIRCYIRNDIGEPTIAILVPEGTASLCRRLSWDISENGYDDFDSRLPMKIFYNMSCYRDEKKDEITSTKKKEFGQIGFEFIGQDNVEADVEAIGMAYDALEEIDVPKETVLVRMGDVRLFRAFTKNVNNVLKEKEVREYLDTISKSRVSGDMDGLEKNIRMLRESMSEYAGNNLIDIMCDPPNDRYMNELENEFGVSITETIDIINMLKSIGIRAYFDPTLARGWEYYTKNVFQIDSIGDAALPEIAGGGRFDALVGSLLRRYGIENIDIPATGFAFGKERLLKLFETYATPGRKTVTFDLEGWK